MGNELGDYFFHLWQEVAYLYLKWQEFIELFGNEPSTIETLNQTAPSFFHMIQKILWQDIILHIARLTDPAHTGRGKQKNFTLMQLSYLIKEEQLSQQIKSELKQLQSKVKTIRYWRHKRIAHIDFNLMMNKHATPLPDVNKQYIEETLKMIMHIINAIEKNYTRTTTRFDLTITSNGALSMLFYLKNGLEATRS